MSDSKPVVVAICLPLADQVHAGTNHSLIALDFSKAAHVHLLDRRGAPVDQARNDLVGRVLMDPKLKDVTHLLWVDDDMIFPQDAFARLLAHDLPVVGGLCHARHPPIYSPILLYKDPANGTYSYRFDFPQGLVEVDGTGGAFLLVKREVFEAIEEKFPTAGEGPFTNSGQGEDVSFCERAKACGYKIFVDTTLDIGHVGEVVVNTAFAKKNRAGEFHPWYPPRPAPEGQPVASIIIPTYNQRPEWLREAVASALAQTAPVEIIVVDDGSDAPVKWGDVFPETGTRAGLTLLNLPHAGCFHALNAGIRAMTTDWFCWLSSDDRFYPTKVARQLRLMLSQDALASFHGFDRMDETGRVNGGAMPAVWKTQQDSKHFLAQGCFINGLTAMIHRSVLDEVGGFDMSFRVSSDWHLWNKVAAKTFWLPIPEILAVRREGESNYSTRYANDPEMRAVWQADDQRIREEFAPRCPHCNGALT